VAGDRIEWRDDAGLVVSLGNSPGGVVAAVSAEGRRRMRYLGVVLGAVLPWLIAFITLVADGGDEPFFAWLGMTIGVIAALVGTEVAFRIERKALRKKAERIRRQLQLVLPPDRSDP
jgi:uncharacterized membrane protein